MVHNHTNQFTGDAFVTFINLDDIDSALVIISRKKLFNTSINVFRSSQQQLQTYLENVEPMPIATSNLNTVSTIPHNQYDSSNLIRVKGIPWTASKPKIVQFYSNKKLNILNGTRGIHFIIGNTKNNQAFIQMASADDYQRAIKSKLMSWEHSIIEGCLLLAVGFNCFNFIISHILLVLVLAANVEDFLKLVNRSTYPSEQNVLRLKDLPVKTTVQDIHKYFEGWFKVMHS